MCVTIILHFKTDVHFIWKGNPIWGGYIMKVKAAFWVSGACTAAATLLRCIQLLFFFNDQTGFVTDSGVFTYIYCGILAASFITSSVLCYTSREICGVMQRGRSFGAATTSFLSAVFLLYCSFVLFLEAYTFKNYGVTYFIEPQHIQAHLPMAVLGSLFGIVSVILGVCWLRGGKLPGGIGITWITAVLWGLYFMVLSFMTHSAAATTQENLFTVGGGALMLLFLLQESKLFSGIGGRRVSQYMYIFGLPASTFWLTYVVSNSVLILFGRGYAAEMPYIIQLAMLVTAIHALSVLFSLRKTTVFTPFVDSTRQISVRSERKETVKSRTNERFN